jgi:zinc and cadmium transporter
MTCLTLRKLLLPLVALSAGTLLGGALFHLLPASIEQIGNRISVYLWLIVGFSVFFALEQFLNWHQGTLHTNRPTDTRRVEILVA